MPPRYLVVNACEIRISDVRLIDDWYEAQEYATKKLKFFRIYEVEDSADYKPKLIWSHAIATKEGWKQLGSRQNFRWVKPKNVGK